MAFQSQLVEAQQHAARPLNSILMLGRLCNPTARLRTLTTIAAARGDGSLAVVFGGFGFTQRQLTKHESLYR